uniref:SsgA family sporulation/cell division regulator n=1 Tax=Sphaerisporangium sp. CA-236357 TaxID=3240030 RepID=UPI003F4937D8
MRPRTYRLCRAARRRPCHTAPSAPGQDVVRAEVRLWLVDDDGIDGEEPMPAVLSYTATEPYAVTLTYHATQWEFSRELLAAGVAVPAGIGGVLVKPAWSDADGEAGVVMVLQAEPEAGCVVQWWTPAGPVQEFLRRTCALVPLGAEPVQPGLDDAIARLLSGPGEAGI